MAAQTPGKTSECLRRGPASAPALPASAADLPKWKTPWPRPRLGAEDLYSALASWQTIAAALGLLAIGLFAWHSLEGPSADELFARIETAALHSDPNALKDVRNDLRNFLQRFPGDDRHSQVQKWNDRAKELAARRHVVNTSRKLKSEGARSPVERAYSDALSLRTSNPELAIQKFRAVVDLYGGSGDDEDECVGLARDELQRLEKQVAVDIGADRKAIETQLAEADRLAAADPESARKVWQAVITLYEEKPWARELVDQAHRALAAPPGPDDQPSAVPVDPHP